MAEDFLDFLSLRKTSPDLLIEKVGIMDVSIKLTRQM